MPEWSSDISEVSKGTNSGVGDGRSFNVADLLSAGHVGAGVQQGRSRQENEGVYELMFRPVVLQLFTAGHNQKSLLGLLISADVQ